MSSAKRRNLRLGAAALALLVLLGVIFRAPLLRATVAALADLATGSQVAFDSLELAPGRAVLQNVVVQRDGAPFLTARRIALTFDLRDYLPRAVQRGALRSADVDGAVLTLSRRADGSFVSLPAGGGPAAARGPELPLRFWVHVANSQVVVRDPSRRSPGARRIELDGVDGAGRVDTGGESRLRARARLRTAGTNADFPVAFDSRADVPRGFAIYRVRAASVPLTDLANFIIDAPSARVISGDGRALDLRIYSLGLGPDDRMHVAGSLAVANVRMRLPGVAVPLEGLRGTLDAFDGGIAARDMHATLAGLPLLATGVLYDWHDPSFRLGVRAAGSLELARALFRFSRTLPLRGAFEAQTLVEGPVGNPLVAASLQSGDAVYANLPLHAVSGRAIYYDNTVTLVPVDASYGPLAVRASGTLDLGKTASPLLFFDADAPPGSVPYVAQAVPSVPLHASGILEGANIALDVRGVVDGSGEGASVAGLFAVDRHGDGEIGPFRIRRADGAELTAAYYANRSASLSAFWADARDFTIERRQPPPRLPGLPSIAPPQFAGRFDADVAGAGPPSNFTVAGRVSGRGASAGPVSIERFDASIAGRPNDTRLGAVTAEGPWGSFSGRGEYAGARLALSGQYGGSFERLRSLTGDLGGHGPLSGPVALVVGDNQTFVQSAGLRSPGATVRGVPVAGVSGTLVVAGRQLQVYAASAEVAGGVVVASGTYGGGAGLNVSIAGADAARLRGAGVPLESGAVDAIGDVRAGPAGPQFDGDVAVTDARALGHRVSANGHVSTAGREADLTGTEAILDSAYGRVDGTVTNLGAGPPHYALSISARDVQIDPFVHYVMKKPPYVRATVNGSLSADGVVGSLPHVNGTVGVPEGNFNGQAFRGATARIAFAPGSLVARAGRVTVGSTDVGFGARVQGNDVAVRVSAPQADLADFDDLFDTGDTLGGRGRVSGMFLRQSGVVHTTGDVAIDALRYRLFELGDATSKWSSANKAVRGTLQVGGASGRLALDGTLSLPPHAPLEKLLARSRFLGNAKLEALDLGVWLPVLGYQLPIAGRVDATANITGSLTLPQVHANATLVGGTLGKLPVQSATADFVATSHGAQIERANFDLGSLVVTGSGTLGFGPNDPLQLAIHATSPDVGALAAKYLATRLTPSGTAEVDLHVAGKRSVPQVSGGFDLEKASLGGLVIPSALGQFTLHGREVVVSGTEINFAKGRLLFAGSIPFTIAPFAFGPSEAPVGLDLTAQGIDLSNLLPLLPKDSALSGKLDGRVLVGGTAGNPHLHGGLQIAGASLQSPLEQVPISNLAAALTFNENTITLDSLHAEAGGGTFVGTGSATLPDLVRPGRDATYALRGSAKALKLDFPAYGRGQVDGDFALAHQPGALATLSGTATLSEALIPFSALLLANTGGAGGPVLDVAGETTAPRPNLALKLDVTAGNNVRVRSANVDIGGRGTLAIAGTYSAPTLTGSFISTGGTLTYFNRVFRIQSGTVTFDPAQGVIPSLDAVAVATVDNPDTNAVRNPIGTAVVTVTVTGPVNSLDIALSSDPQYDREQILGLMLNAPAIGATNLFTTTQPGQQLTLQGSQTQNRSGQTALGQEAFGVVNAQFTRTLLAPFETEIGGALGLSSFAVNINYGGVGLSARKILGKNIDFVYATSFTYPYRQTFGFDLKPNPSTAAQVTVFEQFGAYSFGAPGLTLNPLQPTNLRATAAQPSTGTVGFSLSLQRLYP